ncbi:hypothetical protein VTN77DRAFT_2963 [Rasamsonia byssochlamydoides]|uniref:uncharacterized protein n=1 Tax=Rasamsonia byssochlamydoides TaxID=89139 RepID=UPI00374494A6
MLSRRAGAATVPSRSALRVLRRLALAGSTVGGACTIATITYDVHRRVCLAERIIENKRTIQSSTPYYDATSAARRLARMMEAAEGGEFMGLESLKEDGWKRKSSAQSETNGREQSSASSSGRDHSSNGPTIPNPIAPLLNPPRWPLERNITGTGSKMTAQVNVADSPTEHKGQDRDTSQSETTTTDSGSDTGASRDPVSCVETIRALLDRGRIIEAAEVFLEAHPPSLRGLSSERRELALAIFYTNCKEGNVFIARDIFERLEAVDHVSPRMWKVLMVALAQRGAVESVARLYMRYRNTMTLPSFLIDIVLRSLLESRRLRTAKWLMYGSIKDDRDCGLCGLFLAGLWRKTRDIDLLNTQFQKLLSFLPRFGKQPTEKLFNPVLKAYVEFGRVADAEALANDMQTKYGVPLSCRTKGLLVYAKALACDWDAVERGLQEMHDLGLTSNRVDFIRIFDRIFLEYWVAHSGTAIRDFFFRCVEKYSIVPDRVLYQHVLEAFVEKGDMNLVAELSRLAQDREWKISFDEQKFLETIRSRRHARENSPAGFWQMLQAARVKYGQSATSQQILGYDPRSVPIPEANLMPLMQTKLPWYERTMNEVVPSRTADQFQRLDKQMSSYMHAGNIGEALKAFRNAKAAGFQINLVHVEMAAIATLVEHGLDAARALIEEEWKGIRHHVPFFPLFFRQVTECEPADESEVIKLAVFRFYNLCWETPRLLVKHHFMISTARMLIKKDQYEAALDLLKTAYMSRWGRRDKFDGTCMKMFVRAFAGLDRLKGVRWCILTGLARGSALNKDFVVEVRRVLAARRLKSKPLPAPRARQREQYLTYLDFLADLLEKKCEGIPEMLELRNNRSQKIRTRKLHEWPVAEDRLRCDFASVRRIVEYWDEEYEFEKLFRRINSNPKVVAELWQESRVLGEGDFFVDDF